MILKKLKSKGFTLIELLVVISIISLLSSIVMTSLNSARQKAKNSYTVSTIREYVKAFTAFNLEKGYYPSTSSSVTYACIGRSSIPCFGNFGAIDADFNNQIRPFYSGLPDPSPYSTDSNYVSGALYVCTSPPTGKCISAALIWVKYKSEPCMIPNSTRNDTYGYCSLNLK